jgi:large subunit ribosomal protein L17
MRRNMAQSLFQYGQIETTVAKAKAVRPFVERLITLARRNTLHSRQRLIALLGDRSVISKDQQEKYDEMSRAAQRRVLKSRSGRRHRTGQVPAAYNKKKFTFVAESVVHRLISEVAPRYKDRPGGYTRIIRLAKRRIGDNSDLAILQLVGDEEPTGQQKRKTTIGRRRRAANRIRFAESGAKKKGRRESTAESKPPSADDAARATDDAPAATNDASSDK